MEKEVQTTFWSIIQIVSKRPERERERENRPEGGAEEKEVCKQPPKLKLLENEMNVEIERVRSDELHVAAQRGQHAKCQIRSRDHRNIKVHPRDIHHHRDKRLEREQECDDPTKLHDEFFGNVFWRKLCAD